MLDFNEMLKNMSQHKNFYIRGVVNSLLPEFANPLDSTITEENVSGEMLEALKLVVATKHPKLGEGQVASINYDDVQKLFGSDDMGEEIRSSLGQFGVTVKDGEVFVFDTYDFEPRGGFDSFMEAAVKSKDSKSPYPLAEFFGGVLMPENPDGSSREDAMRVKIKLSKEQKVVETDFDDDIPENATSFVLRGAMTNKRKQIFEEQFADQYAGGIIDNFFDTIKAPLEILENKNLQKRGNTYTPLGDTNYRRDQKKSGEGGIGKRMGTMFEQIGLG